jgi:hypothetical protein
MSGNDTGGAVDAASMPDGGHDAGAADAGRDAGRPDAGHDAGARDAGHDGGRDAAMTSDAGHDAAIVADAGRDAAMTSDTGERQIECVPAVAGNELSSGMVLDANFWVGFRFEVTSATTLTGVGLDLVPSGGASGTLFAGVVALTGSSDTPDTPDLSGADVVASGLVPVTGAGGSSVIARGAMSASLAPGWYALEVGVGGGATLVGGATVHSNSGAGGCTMPGASFPFSIRQSDGMFILQAATPNLFVTVSP